MSSIPDEAAKPREAQSAPAVETVVVPRSRDLGGFEVRRVLPSVRRRMVGPFIFLDHMGPTRFEGGTGVDVRPHPHIGLATVTYLLRGSILHRDSLRNVQPITPGDVNWMTAGRGIVHSERSDRETRMRPHELYGLQLWVALPRSDEETNPAFAHHPQSTLPRLEDAGVRARVIAGSAFGRTSPVATRSELFFVDVELEPGARLRLDTLHEERAAYLLEGRLEIEAADYDPLQLLVFAPRREVIVTALSPARLALVGGEPMDGPRHIWWNFVSSRPERIEQAKAAWKRNRFDLTIPGETEFIPLPDGP